MVRDERETAATRLAPGVAALVDAFTRDGSAQGRDAAAAEFIAVPSPERARFLVPGRDRRTAVRVLLDYNRLRPARVRRLRSAVGAALAVAPAGVWNSRRVLLPGAAALLEHLGEVLDEPGLLMGLGVPSDDPNAKPTLQLFAPGGRAVGYAKLGWTPSTGDLVRAEADGLGLGATCGPSVHVPAVLAETTWGVQPVTVVAPLPPGVRRWPDDDRPPAAEVLADLAGPVTRRAVTTSGWWAGAQRTLTEIEADPTTADLARVCRETLERLAGAEEARATPLATWHGDLTPWNICVEGDDVHLIDWEHAGQDVPLGFDLAHWAFQVAVVLRHEGAEAGAGHALEAVRTYGPAVGVDPARAVWTTDAYLLEMALRTFRLQRHGGGWNPDLYPALPRLLAEHLGLDPWPHGDRPQGAGPGYRSTPPVPS